MTEPNHRVLCMVEMLAARSEIRSGFASGRSGVGEAVVGGAGFDDVAVEGDSVDDRGAESNAAKLGTGP